MRRVFRLYPEKGRSLYVRAIVHSTKKEMFERWAELNDLGVSDRPALHYSTGAFCNEWMRWDVGPGGAYCRRDQCVAEVNFWEGWLDARVVSHEMFHAIAAWGRRIRFDWPKVGSDESVTEHEERMAYALGEVCGQFTKRATDAGISIQEYSHDG